jgi:hypothetical protein
MQPNPGRASLRRERASTSRSGNPKATSLTAERNAEHVLPGSLPIIFV